MSFTSTQLEIYEYCRKADFISSAEIEKFWNRLDQDGHVSTLPTVLEKFLSYSCPNCRAHGAFKWHFLGKLRHPSCNFTWYVGPRTYAVEQLRAVFTLGTSFDATIGTTADKKGVKVVGYMGARFGFILIILLRLSCALLMITIQTPISLTQRKPESSG